MGAYDNIDFALFEIVEDELVFFGAAEARHHFDPNRGISETGAESVPMLLGKDRGRNQHRDLKAGKNRDRSGAHRNFSFAEASIAADQAIHRLGTSHVAYDVVDCGLLIGSLFELETFGEILIVGAWMRESVPLLHFTSGVNVEQFGSHREDSSFGALLKLLP